MPEEVEQGQEQQEASELTFDSWLEQQDETVKSLLDGHTKGLKSALGSERAQRKAFEKEVRDAQSKLKKDSEEWKALEALAGKSEKESRRADAYEQLHAAGVSNLKAAYTLAAADELFDRRGNVDVEALKGAYPELFPTRKGPPGNAGNGTDDRQRGPSSMNDMIRHMAGRG